MTWHQTIVVGNVGREPETRMAGSGTVCNFSAAVTEKWNRAGDNIPQERTTWYSVEAWGKLGEVCQKYITKGRQVMVIGKTRVEAYIDKEGVAVGQLRLRANEVRFIGTRNDAGSSLSVEDFGSYPVPAARNDGNDFAPPAAAVERVTPAQVAPAPQDIDDIPF